MPLSVLFVEVKILFQRADTRERSHHLLVLTYPVADKISRMIGPVTLRAGLITRSFRLEEIAWNAVGLSHYLYRPNNFEAGFTISSPRKLNSIFRPSAGHRAKLDRFSGALLKRWL
jgi:hypothetical protein